MTTVVQLPDRDSITALVARQVRAELTWRNLTLKQLANLTGRNYGHWQRRLAGTTPIDVEDLGLLASIFECSPGDLLPRGTGQNSTGPEGPGTWAPSGSNRRPMD